MSEYIVSRISFESLTDKELNDSDLLLLEHFENLITLEFDKADEYYEDIYIPKNSNAIVIQGDNTEVFSKWLVELSKELYSKNSDLSIMLQVSYSESDDGSPNISYYYNGLRDIPKLQTSKDLFMKKQ